MINTKIPEGAEIVRTLSFRLLDQVRTFQAEIYPISHIKSRLPDADFLSEASNVLDFNFLEINEDTKEIYFKAGEWVLDKDLRIPSGYSVVAPEGLKLSFRDNAILVSKSPLNFQGTADSPILIQSKYSGSIFVHDVEAPSKFSYVRVKGLSAPQRGTWGLTGAITFYRAPISLSFVELSDMQAEDGLNVINTEFSISDSSFRDTKSDGIDSDFSSGVIRNSSFKRMGNDGIDFSGSDVLAQNLHFSNIGEKAISVGESSRVSLNNISIEEGDIGLASKDASSVKIDVMSLKNLKIGLACFQKKSEYGPATIVASKVSTENVERPFVKDEHSELNLESNQLIEVDKKIYEKLYLQNPQEGA
jgi:hypothetical protein